ncbi:MAG: phosphate acyltransferase PlsX [Candidatus Omnitrophica bacterium]|nr:phosphate acyltransferase PlsX [Candidatus Omnitrophota bacterium]
MIIAVDAMGGDKGPQVVVKGAVEAVKEFPSNVLLVGDERRIKKELSLYNYPVEKISIKSAKETIEMGETPVAALKKKKGSSIGVAIDLLKEEKADALVSAGNTGAVVAAATLKLRLLPSIERAGIAVVIPTLKEPSLLIDVGANISPKPLHLLQYAIMVKVYSEEILGRVNPKVGLLNIGTEESKGTGFIKETFDFLKAESSLNFIGYIEGHDVFSGEVDCVICDGFVGNIILKVSESLGEVTNLMLKRELNRNIFAKITSSLFKFSLGSFKKKLDYSEYGGAPLLGTQKVCIIAHGVSSSRAIKNAIRVAYEFVGHQINKDISTALLKK